MPWNTAPTFGAASAIRALTSSAPPATYLSLQGVPRGRGAMQSRAMLEKPMSLPPTCSVTTSS